MDNGEPIKVMIVDDHPVVRSGLATMLQAFDDLQCVGEAANGRIALQVCREVSPDVILMDMIMPEMDGLETTRAVLEMYPSVKVVILSSFTEKDMVHDALAAGATSYILKESPIDKLAEVIRMAHAGQSTLSPEATRSLVRKSAEAEPAVGSDLTEREKQVLALIVDGLSNEEIAERLMISPATSRHHVSACISKIGASNRTQAAVTALKHGLI